MLMGCLCLSGLFAQNETDILRYSQNYNLGTARSQGAGGAFGSVGADYSSVYINPAGLGLYRRNEFNFSGAITGTTSNSSYLGNSQYDSRTNFNIPSFGIVFSKVNTGLSGDATDGIVNYNFAFGYTRTNNFQQNIYFDGYNTKSNISQFYVQQANGVPYSQVTNPDNAGQFYNLAWNTYLIDTASNSSSYYSPYFARDNDYRLLQSQSISRRGAMGEYNFNAAINIGNVVYLGAGLVLSNVHYESTTTFKESDPNRTVVDSVYGHMYNSSSLKSDLTSEGSGVSGRFGLIVRPHDFVRIGFTAQTATRINFTDNYNYTVTSDINYPGIGKQSSTGPGMTYTYAVVTPAKFSASFSLMHPDIGFLSFDADMIDYTRGRLTSTDYSFGNENTAARNSFTQAYNYRVGGELKLQKMYRLRAGYSLSTSPYKAMAGFSAMDLSRQSYSLGAGYTNGQHFVDFAAVTTMYKEFNSPYVVEGGYTPTAVIDHTMLNFVLTAGVKF